MQNIAIINGAPTVVSDADLSAMIPAFQKYVDHFLIPAWTFLATTLHFVPHGHHADPSYWWIVVNNRSDEAGALGYHATQPNGHPYARIFAGDDKADGVSLSVTLTHELAEMLGDPDAQETTNIHGKHYAKELCDAVEDDGLAITIDGVACSDFVLPAYFDQHHSGPYDYQHKLAGPCPQLLPGGYMDYQEGGQWHQVTARLADGGKSYRSGRNGRGQRRSACAVVVVP